MTQLNEALKNEFKAKYFEHAVTECGICNEEGNLVACENSVVTDEYNNQNVHVSCTGCTGDGQGMGPGLKWIINCVHRRLLL